MNASPHRYSFRNFVLPAFLEEEGLGTAYEYYTKYQILKNSMLARHVNRLLIAGLPEKYGFSMDFTSYAIHSNAELTIMDDRPYKIAKHKLIMKKLFGKEAFDKVKYVYVKSWLKPPYTSFYDIALSCEVFQRFNEKEKESYVAFLGDSTNCIAIFVPNAANKAHATISKLKTVSLDELTNHFKLRFKINKRGYLDMPPSPPGRYASRSHNNTLAKRLSTQILEAWYWLIESTASNAIPVKRFYHLVYNIGERVNSLQV